MDYFVLVKELCKSLDSLLPVAYVWIVAEEKRRRSRTVFGKDPRGLLALERSQVTLDTLREQPKSKCIEGHNRVTKVGMHRQ